MQRPSSRRQAISIRGSAKNRIHLKHALSMTAGLKWNEWNVPYTDPRNDHVAMNSSSDPIRYNLARPVVEPAGARFVYNSGMSIALGQVIYTVSGERADKFAERYLFQPLGISHYYWWTYPNGTGSRNPPGHKRHRTNTGSNGGRSPGGTPSCTMLR